MKIGYACIPLGVKYSTNRRFLLKNFSEDRFLDTTMANLLDLKKILKYNIENGIYLFRISSDIIPLGSHNINDLQWYSLFKDILKDIGNYIKTNNIRVTMHPGQYTVLNSPNPEVVKKSIKDIEYHCTFLDSINADYKSKIIIHVGGIYNDKYEAMDRFKLNFKLLSESAKKRLIIENDEKSYSISDVLNIGESIAIPVVFDNLHHSLNPSLSPNIKDILHRVSKTWGTKDGPMKLHYSDMAHNKKPGAHSNFVNTSNFLEFYNEVSSLLPDIMLEVKDKDLSAIKCIDCVTPHNVDINNIWDKYKFTVLERSQSLYDKCYNALKSNDVFGLYKEIDKALSMPIKLEYQIHTLKYILHAFEDNLLPKEQNRLLSLINKNEISKAKGLLNRISTKNNLNLTNTYFFIY